MIIGNINPTENEKTINTLEMNKHELERIICDSHHLVAKFSECPAISDHFASILEAVIREDNSLKQYICLLDDINKYLNKYLLEIQFDIESTKDAWLMLDQQIRY